MFDYYQTAIPVIALLVGVAVQVSVARLDPRTGYLRSLFACVGAGLISVFALEGGAYPFTSAPWQEAAAVMLVNTATFAALVCCYLMFFVMSCRSSVRVQLFRELQRSGGGLSLEQLLARYNQRTLVEMRLERLLRRRQLVLRDGRYFLNSPALRLLAAVVRGARMLVIGEDAEFAGVTRYPSRRGSPRDHDFVTGNAR